jgi:hypothetical protein
MFSKNIIPLAGSELAQSHGGVADTDHSVSAFGSSIGTLMRCSMGLDILSDYSFNGRLPRLCIFWKVAA